MTLADMELDLAELVRLLERTHPDPYAAGGGMLAFHRRADAVRRALPADGLPVGDFLRRLRPLVASVGDGHTRMGPAEASEDGPRLWLEWGVVQDGLYVTAAYREEDRPLLGRRLRAVAGVTAADLAARVRRLVGVENEYGALAHLASMLRSPTLLRELVEVTDPLRVAFEPGHEVVLPMLRDAPGEALRPASTVTMPPLGPADIGWGFIGEAAILRVDSMVAYREVFESARATGLEFYLGDRLTATARAALGGAEPPEGVDARIAAVPSGTEILRELFGSMRERGTRTLIVDLRANRGGNSLLAWMLAYFLHGTDGLAAIDNGYRIPRYSALHRQNYPAMPHPDGYDFSEEVAWHEGRRGPGEVLQRFIATAPTFAREYESGRWGAARSLRVIVLTSAATYSAGYDVARILYRLGAELVGVPSAQAGNCFGDALQLTLPRSGLKGSIAYVRMLPFPDDPEAGRVLRPARELSYADLAAMDFDPNATVRLALERAEP